MTNRHTFATQSPTKGRQICQCPECQGHKPEPQCKHTREMFKREEMIGPRVSKTAPASIAQRNLFEEEPTP